MSFLTNSHLFQVRDLWEHEDLPTPATVPGGALDIGVLPAHASKAYRLTPTSVALAEEEIVPNIVVQ